jgi:NAD(P)-dependent dehydrogenase (short-subunit alcohol dehydrogenase family)
MVAKQVAVVTGTASGVGNAVGRRLRARGWTVIGVDLAVGAPDAVDHQVTGSVADAATWTRVRETALTQVGAAPTVLVFNAAVLHTGTVLDLTEEQWQACFDVNVTGVFHGTRALLPGMIEAGGGSIVAVASVDAFMAEQGLAAYCSSKGALLQLTRCLAVDHARQGVRVNCVAPGVIDTPFFRRHLETASDPERFLRVREERNPLGRLLAPEDVAVTVEFAALDAAGMTGSMLTVDAGLSASFDFRTGVEGA